MSTPTASDRHVHRFGAHLLHPVIAYYDGRGRWYHAAGYQGAILMPDNYAARAGDTVICSACGEAFIATPWPRVAQGQQRVGVGFVREGWWARRRRLKVRRWGCGVREPKHEPGGGRDDSHP